MTLTKSFIMVLALGIFSCNSGKKATDEAAMDEASGVSVDSKKMMADGFMSGTIVHSRAEGDCPYTINVDSEDYSYMLDPINLEEEFKADGTRIWFKFAGLRMANRCTKANPVNIIEMQKM